MANKRVKGLAGLEQAIDEVLKEYSDEVSQITGEVIVESAKEGARAIKDDANQIFDPRNRPSKGRYGTGWTVTVEESRLETVAYIHNKKYPGLPHLLEFGHLIRGGMRTMKDRTKARPHIEPVRDKLEDELQRKLMVKL